MRGVIDSRGCKGVRSEFTRGCLMGLVLAVRDLSRWTEFSVTRGGRLDVAKVIQMTYRRWGYFIEKVVGRVCDV